jgi:hypothetical protein
MAPRVMLQEEEVAARFQSQHFILKAMETYIQQVDAEINTQVVVAFLQVTFLTEGVEVVVILGIFLLIQ